MDEDGDEQVEGEQDAAEREQTGDRFLPHGRRDNYSDGGQCSGSAVFVEPTVDSKLIGFGFDAESCWRSCEKGLVAFSAPSLKPFRKALNAC